MTVRRPRKAQSQTATGKASALTDAASGRDYPKFPADLVKLSTNRRDRQTTLGWFGYLIKHRVPEAWLPADVPRAGFLARFLMVWERETGRLMERDGGDMKLAEHARAGAMGFARQLGLSVAIKDPRLSANDAMAREEAEQTLLDLADDDGLIARPSARRLN
jgi:hypothetical protein